MGQHAEGRKREVATALLTGRSKRGLAEGKGQDKATSTSSILRRRRAWGQIKLVL